MEKELFHKFFKELHIGGFEELNKLDEMSGTLDKILNEK